MCQCRGTDETPHIRALGPREPRPYSSAYNPVSWRDYWDFGTAPIGDFFCHNFDPACWALDLKQPEGLVLARALVQQAVQLMTDKKISSVLVAEADGKLVGIVTTTDLLSLLERLLVAVDQK